MPIAVTWGGCSKPGADLCRAQERMALEVAKDGEYEKVIILHAAVHFKVELFAKEQNTKGHKHLIMFQVSGGPGTSNTRYHFSGEGPNFDHSRLVVVNKPPSNCPKKIRERREKEAASSSSQTTGNGSATADGWYGDPWKQATHRYYQKGEWTQHTMNK
ncbi:unnamed protein product [Clonostachys rosea]|uniref:Uncharacterized protein n=1 Tax=Bionectria ochroleuca TaxID=29856 RepID=A0ABY6UMW4_BIOOC|nr:unnamed protein product [Clonostachys rosea]